MCLFACTSKLRRKFRKWRSAHKQGKSGSVKRYSRKWWFWTDEGRSTWDKCQSKGKDSRYWADNRCGDRVKPAKGSKWWWWTRRGRDVWSQCKEKGEDSSFWKDNDCSAGR